MVRAGFFFWLHWVFIAVNGLSLVTVFRLLIIVASLVEEHRFSGVRASVAVFLRLSCSEACGIFLTII